MEDNFKYNYYDFENHQKIKNLKLREKRIKEDIDYYESRIGIHKNFLTFPLIISVVGGLFLDICNYANYNAVIGFIPNFLKVVPFALVTELIFQKVVFINENNKLNNLNKQLDDLKKEEEELNKNYKSKNTSCVKEDIEKLDNTCEKTCQDEENLSLEEFMKNYLQYYKEYFLNLKDEDLKEKIDIKKILKK